MVHTVRRDEAGSILYFKADNPIKSNRECKLQQAKSRRTARIYTEEDIQARNSIEKKSLDSPYLVPNSDNFVGACGSMNTQPLLERYGKEREDKVVVKCEEVADVTQIADVKFHFPYEVEIQKEMDAQSSWMIARWCRNRIVDPFLVILRRGLGPKQLSISAALGITLGVFPVYGVTVLLCAIAAALLRSNCHVPTLMLANLVATPLEIGLVVPFLRMGEWVSGGEHFLLTADALWKAITGRASHAILYGLLHALIGWAIMAPLLLGGLYVIFLPLFHCLIRRFGNSPLVQIRTPVAPQVLKHGIFPTPLKDSEI